ncbi:hypothetical protein EMEDMD4_350014 [Sinorhizobium medicae]|uniref:Uncharacterized protein n=1 Tax=Sinorhizobium medicae TaxID=110321 RepID=A0A508X2D9_9HYPH|nr:hypothetical protein EMEDMD4_350014 [Sinorhizobium medicae]
MTGWRSNGGAGRLVPFRVLVGLRRSGVKQSSVLAVISPFEAGKPPIEGAAMATKAEAYGCRLWVPCRFWRHHAD